MLPRGIEFFYSPWCCRCNCLSSSSSSSSSSSMRRPWPSLACNPTASPSLHTKAHFKSSQLGVALPCSCLACASIPEGARAPAARQGAQGVGACRRSGPRRRQRLRAGRRGAADIVLLLQLCSTDLQSGRSAYAVEVTCAVGAASDAWNRRTASSLFAPVQGALARAISEIPALAAQDSSLQRRADKVLCWCCLRSF